MPGDLAALIQKIADKRNITTKSVDRLILQKERKTLFPRRLATFAVAVDSNVPVNRFATDEELGQLREMKGQRSPAAAAPAAQPVTRASAPARASAPVARATKRRPAAKPAAPKAARSILVVHGRDTGVQTDFFAFLRNLDLLPIEWVKAIASTKKGNATVQDIVDELFKMARAVVVLMTPDDLVTLAPRLRKTTDHPNESQVVGQARPNVFYEAGMAMSLFRDTTVFVQVGVVKAFSDIGGTHITRLSNSATSRKELATKLEAAGLAVDTDGTAWLEDGDFDRKDLNALSYDLSAL